jgi:glyoxylate/hydroxypyruvate reductase
MSFVYKADPARGRIWAELFARHAPELPFHIWPDTGDPARVRFLAAWEPPRDIAGLFPNLEIVFSTGAGVDQFDLRALPPGLPVVRMLEPGIAACVTEYVSFAVLALHRDMPLYLQQQRECVWREHPVRPAARRRVGVMGMGTLGRAVLAQLRALGFECAGWNRSPRTLEGVRCYTGPELHGFLEHTEILVCQLPLTESTRGILRRELFEALPAGAALVNAGRGGHLVQQDLLEALDSGRLRAAVLDVCEPEPLARDHPFWRHPRIWLTPHIASITQPETAVQAVLENLRRHAQGLPLHGLVDPARGY